MDDQVSVSVWRVDSHLPKESPRAIETHRLRAAALHDIFDSAPGATVRDWGKTDDSESHEVVELVVGFVQWATQPQQLAAAGTAAVAIGKFLAATVVGEVAKEGVIWLYGRLRKKQQDGQIQNASVSVTPTINIAINDLKFGGAVYVTVQVEGKPFNPGAR